MSNLFGDLPRLFPRPGQTIAGIGRILRRGELGCVDILNACLEVVDERESRVRAWVVIDREGAMEQARSLDSEFSKGGDRGPLHGIPIGIKDIIDVKGLPTGCGAKRRDVDVAEKDAMVVALLRRAGAVILGKTVTTPHAWIDPPPTRNPWNLERTPGGSSSGSAAAVSTGMCYAAIGSQTGGSITRPASFCGVAGLKPTHDRLEDHSGVSPLAPSLDHVGPIARTVEDLHLISRAMRPFELPVTSDILRQTLGAGPPRIGRLRGFFDRRAQPIASSIFEQALRMLADRGATIVDLDDPVNFEGVLQDHRCVMAAEAAGVHSGFLEANSGDYPPRIRDLILEGRSIPAMDYILSRKRMRPARTRIEDAMVKANVWGLITPATVSTAPEPSTTGDPAFNSPWSYMHLPTVSIPAALAADGLPVAIQLIGRLDGDPVLLLLGRWCEEAMHVSHE